MHFEMICFVILCSDMLIYFEIYRKKINYGPLDGDGDGDGDGSTGCSCPSPGHMLLAASCTIVG